jgi:hypothetical protein
MNGGPVLSAFPIHGGVAFPTVAPSWWLGLLVMMKRPPTKQTVV